MALKKYQEEEYIVLADQELRERAKKKLLAFTLYTKPDYEVNWHHSYMCKVIDRFIRREITHLMVFMPPRHGKSELTSRRLPAMLHGLYPDDQIITASYNSGLASDMTRDVQRIIDSKEYATVFPDTKITAEGGRSAFKRASNEHHIFTPVEENGLIKNKRRGLYRSGGINGAFTGRGANWILIDDPFKNQQEADSEAFRRQVWNSYQSSLLTRLEKLGSVLITMTRWHEDDLSGRLIHQMKKDPAAQKFHIINFPAIRDNLSNQDDPRDIGDPLWENKYTKDRLLEIKRAVGPRVWSALYQQTPRVMDGGLFESRMFEFASMPTEFDYMFATADTSYKGKETNDFTAITIFGVKNDRLFVPASFMKRIKATDAEGIFKTFIKPWVKYNFRATMIEPKGHGIYLNNKLISEGIRIPSETNINEFFKDRRLDKVERANNAIPHLATRSVIINEAIPHRQDLVDQCLVFPNGAHDDFVDTLVDGIKFAYGAPVSLFDML
jgi:predicted phage terminase large subunit-like protein